MAKRLKTCCITGHRDIPPEKVDFVRTELQKQILTACASGYNYFISGFADGADVIFAEILADIKQGHDIYLEAALPYPRKRTKAIEDLLKQCDKIHTVSEKYFPACFMKRNVYMTDHSDLVIAVYDGRTSGGTLILPQTPWKMEVTAPGIV